MSDNLITVWNPGLASNTYAQARDVLLSEESLIWPIVHDPRYPHADVFQEQLQQLQTKLVDGGIANIFIAPTDPHREILWGKVIAMEEGFGKDRLDDPRVPAYLRQGGAWEIATAFRLVDLREIPHHLFKRIRPLVEYDRDRWGAYGGPFPCPADFDADGELHRHLFGVSAERKIGGLKIGPDGRCANLNGKVFTLTSQQADIVEILFSAMENGTPDIGEAYIMDKLAKPNQRLRDAFKGYPAWEALVIKGKRAGTYRLNAG